MSLFQRIAVIIALVCAALTSTTVLSTLNTAKSGSDAASYAIQNFNSQTASDTTVYQQQVSALWANKDLLRIVADETADANKLAAGQLQVSIATNWLLAALVGVLATMAMGAVATKKKPKPAPKAKEQAAPAAE